ncbi:MAG: TolC family protein [Bacteroidales bacterium]|jgi:outer membrane protein TolC|nr:TolC family protein [Bacteroidales bacterium]
MKNDGAIARITSLQGAKRRGNLDKTDKVDKMNKSKHYSKMVYIADALLLPLKHVFLILLFSIFNSPFSILHCQDTLIISLNDAISRSITNSVDAVVAKNEYKSSYWEYRTYKAQMLPEISVDATLPYYSKSYNSYQSEDGSYTFVKTDYSILDAGLSISQNIPFTGGVISMESSLERLRQYGENGSKDFMAVPFSVTLEQPLSGYNHLRWLRKIETMKYKEAEQKLIADLEDVSHIAIQYYFNFLLGQINLEIAEQNLKNSQKIYSIAEAKRKIGQISETDMLQLKVSLLKAESYMTDAKASFDNRMFQLRSYLGISEAVILLPVIPDLFAREIPLLHYSDVLEMAHSNNSFTQNIQRRMLEASQNVSQAKSDRWNASLFLSFGMSNQDALLSETYNVENWRDNQIINLGIRTPIIDWGKSKGKVKIAEANREVVISRIEKEKIDFNQNIFLIVQNFNNQSKQLSLAKETDEIAQQRYQTSIETFILGKIDVLNLNDAQVSKDEAKRNYMEQMFLLWSYYYQIRSLTLYDFVNNSELTINYDAFVN